ncbi:alpha/beta hydrolase [Variovorax rhizosphaerae]|uniref:Alpha/beta hydrolase n=1 Tax=Variovorax rhizosphaerae TaxID=1836200 RepID=A0ABU8WS07_9BURK
MKPASVMLLLLASCAIALAAPAMFQDRLLYYPDKAPIAEMVSPGLAAWPSDGDFRGLVAQPSGAAARGTALVFHGNAGHAGHRSYYAATLTRLGLRVILAEYPAYGPREGAVGERSLVDDAAQSIAQAHNLYGAPLLVVGESLGAGVAAAASAKQRESVAALMLITPWDKLENVASHHYPWLPVGWLLRDRYDSAANLAAISRPVMVVVAERDSVVPARFGTALYEGLPSPKRLEVVRRADHNDWPRSVDDAWWRSAMQFLLLEPASR